MLKVETHVENDSETTDLEAELKALETRLEPDHEDVTTTLDADANDKEATDELEREILAEIKAEMADDEDNGDGEKKEVKE